MRRFLITIAAATAFVGAPIMGASVGAAPIVAPGAIRAATDSLKLTENVQFFWNGYDYCWYDDGWNGPGWYRCDMYLQSGIGWGGGYGWHGWRGGHRDGRRDGRRDGHRFGAGTVHSGRVSGAGTVHSGRISGAGTVHSGRVSGAGTVHSGRVSGAGTVHSGRGRH
jgi:hypothetical protein